MKTYIWLYVGGYEGEEQCIVAVKAENLRGAQQRAIAELKNNRKNYSDDTMAENIADGHRPDLVLDEGATAGHWSIYS
jgi:hypothetical protein